MQSIEYILIIDYGSQYTQLISRRFRELHVYSHIVAWDQDPKDNQAIVSNGRLKGIVLSGGPNSINDEDAPVLSSEVLALNVPILSICYGMHLIAQCFGGSVTHQNRREYGAAKITLWDRCPLFEGLDPQTETAPPYHFSVWMSHGDHVDTLPSDFVSIASTDSLTVAAFAHTQKPIYGLQFHPEVTHTTQGQRMLKNFAFNICHCAGDWVIHDFIENSTKSIRHQVGHENVILGLSGGVDSAVAAVLISRAIGKQLHCIFVDHGLLRYHEASEVMTFFQNQMDVEVTSIDASERFFQKLAGVEDPEHKRKIIGRLFIEVFDQAAQQQIDTTHATWLAQGTIYPDVIESAGGTTKKARNIKSHHNVGGLPDQMHLKLLEPLRDLFKDEVRHTGTLLGLPDSLINRHPFPGPGLAVRILGEVTRERVSMLQQADAIFIRGLRESGWYDQVSQAFAVFLPIRSVGVMGDARTYQNTIALRAVQTEDFMTAPHAPLPHDLLGRWAQEIVNNIDGINRVVYDITSKPPATIEWE